MGRKTWFDRLLRRLGWWRSDLNDQKPRRYWSHGFLANDGGPWRVEWAVPLRPHFDFALSADVASAGRWMLHLEFLDASLFVCRHSQDADMREYGLKFHNGSLWWKWGADAMGWSNATPRWRDGCWHVAEWVLGPRRSEVEEVLEEREVGVPMPEGVYPVKARLEVRVVRGRFRTRRWRAVNLEVLRTKGGIPHDGKGESGYDCGPDGTFGLYTHDCASIEEGVGQLVATCLRNRARYGNAFAERDGRMGGVRCAPGVAGPEVSA
jgi:hypothetical protein